MIFDKPQAQLAEKQRASAFSCVADLFMTEPLCDEPEAEKTCEASLAEALSIDPSNIDALQSLANLRTLRGRDKEAYELLS